MSVQSYETNCSIMGHDWQYSEETCHDGYARRGCSENSDEAAARCLGNLTGKTRYVVGFCFDDSCPEDPRVVLIRKNRPEWQSGLLNGVGGHIEPSETPVEAMRREFMEETGLRVDVWDHYVTLIGDTYVVYFFRSEALTSGVRSLTDEEVLRVRPEGRDDMISNLKWLIPMARDIRRQKPIIVEQGEING